MQSETNLIYVSVLEFHSFTGWLSEWLIEWLYKPNRWKRQSSVTAFLQVWTLCSFYCTWYFMYPTDHICLCSDQSIYPADGSDMSCFITLALSFKCKPLLFLTVVKAQLYASGMCDWEILSSKDSWSLIPVNPTPASMNVLWISLFHGRTVVFCILLWWGLFSPCCNIFGSY